DLTNWSTDDLETIKKVVGQNFDRRSFESTITQAVVLYAEVVGGRLKYVEGVRPPNLESLFDDFESEQATAAAAHVRMSVNQVFMFHESKIGSAWANYFWNRGLELESVATYITRPIRPERTPGLHPGFLFGIDYEDVAVSSFDELWVKL